MTEPSPKKIEAILELLQLYVEGGSSLSRDMMKKVLLHIKRQDEKIWALSEDNMLRGIEITELQKFLDDSNLSLPVEKQKQLSDSRQFSTRRIRKLIIG